MKKSKSTPERASTLDGNSEAATEWRLPREFFGLVFLFWAVFTFLGLVSYDYLDPGFNNAAGAGEVRNMTGVVGAYWSGLVVDFFGLGTFLLPFLFLWSGLRLLLKRVALSMGRWAGLLLFSAAFLAFCGSTWAATHFSIGQVQGGGFLGDLLYGLLVDWFSSFGAGLVLFFCFILSLQLLFRLSWRDGFARSVDYVAEAVANYRERLARGRYVDAEELVQGRTYEDEEEPPEEKGPNAVDRFLDMISGKLKAEPAEATGSEDAEEKRERPVVAKTKKAKVKKPAKQPAKQAAPKPKPGLAKKIAAGDAPLPTLDLLSPLPPEAKAALDPETPKRQAENLDACLKNFNIQGDVQRIVPGPVVTMFEFKPAPGVKVSKIAGLSDDIALAMKALAVRIEAPIPGKDTVGVEVPSEQRQTVYLREILESKAFNSSKSKLTLAIGKDIQGAPQVADLAKMPHLLVAGATGAGKSVCINGLLLSILYKARPDEVKLLLVDPKRIELSVYNDLPHLVHPVVTEMAMAKSALEWAVHEMDKRYESMARLGVRNITGFNDKVAKLGDDRPEGLEDMEHMPYLVIIIDELADLMMTAAKDVEFSIVRLAQLARAAGVHMVLATQRPSVDVVTGLIKANFPTRISFQVTSKHDSRTILDTVGAEHLLGRGDMLFKPSGGRITRMHGAFVSDEETAEVVGFWKERGKPGYAVDFAEWQSESADNGGGGGDAGGAGGGGGDGYDSMYDEAVEFVVEQGKASISLLQRRFRIGFNRSARLIEQMERDGLLGPQEGSKPRSVLRGKDYRE